MNVPCWTCDWVTAFGSVSGNTSPSPSYAIVRSIYVAEMWLSLSLCFYLVDNSARVNITQLYKHRAARCMGGAIKRKRIDGVGWKISLRAFRIYRRPVHDSIYALKYLAETRAGAMPLWQYVHSVFDSLSLSLPTSFRSEAFARQICRDAISTRAAGKNPCATLWPPRSPFLLSFQIKWRRGVTRNLSDS